MLLLVVPFHPWGQKKYDFSIFVGHKRVKEERKPLDVIINCFWPFVFPRGEYYNKERKGLEDF